ncbi:uncharacterized protein LOC123267328 [Cotesia glomerata]|uniref:uncharacterized protein LOC123267328 n=1 Tax=Cotesia glomerata TaxID=32391 RepID=UPI001D02839D|nr:uncharacterized protein LOC123267328 [Cotesia glomerata]
MSNGNKENELGAEEPEFTADHKEKILNGFEMDYSLYYLAITAQKNSSRAKKVMSQLWPKEECNQLLVKFDEHRPHMRVVTEAEYVRLLVILTKLNQIRRIKVFSPNEVPQYNIKRWVSEWLRSTKYTAKKVNPNPAV